MSLFFQNELFERFMSTVVGHTYYGGADLGECAATAARIVEGDEGSWHREWSRTAERIYAIGEDCSAKGHRVSARQAYLRAAVYYRASYLFLFGAPVDPRLLAQFAKESEAFRKAAALFDTPAEPVEIPYEGTTLPGYWYRPDSSGQRRPTLIATNGYDHTLPMMHFAFAAAAVERGYNCLIFDGPGQGRALIKQGLAMRPDWEHVVGPVIDHLLAQPEVDADKIALAGWSFGGYLAPRAASGDPRLAAVIADPGTYSLAESGKMLFAQAAPLFEQMPHVDPALLEPLFEAIRSHRMLQWTFVQRGLWVHGLERLFDYFVAAMDYTLAGRAELIRCPALILTAEGDAVPNFAERLFEELQGPKTFIRFTKEEGAEGHCECFARSLVSQRVFDWLDETLA